MASGDSRVWVPTAAGYIAGSVTVHDAGGDKSEVETAEGKLLVARGEVLQREPLEPGKVSPSCRWHRLEASVTSVSASACAAVAARTARRPLLARGCTVARRLPPHRRALDPAASLLVPA